MLYKDLIICVLFSIVDVLLYCLEPDLVILWDTVSTRKRSERLLETGKLSGEVIVPITIVDRRKKS